jgi:hypothetical protein
MPSGKNSAQTSKHAEADRVPVLQQTCCFGQLPADQQQAGDIDQLIRQITGSQNARQERDCQDDAGLMLVNGRISACCKSLRVAGQQFPGNLQHGFLVRAGLGLHGENPVHSQYSGQCQQPGRQAPEQTGICIHAPAETLQAAAALQKNQPAGQNGGGRHQLPRAVRRKRGAFRGAG